MISNSSSPLVSPGIIGHPPSGLQHNNTSTVPHPPPSPLPPSYISHHSNPSQPRTPGPNGEFDVASLLAHAARQSEAKTNAAPMGGMNGFNGMTAFNGVGVIGDGMTPKRNGLSLMGNDDIWSDQPLRRTASNHTYGAPGSGFNSTMGSPVPAGGFNSTPNGLPSLGQNGPPGLSNGSSQQRIQPFPEPLTAPFARSTTPLSLSNNKESITEMQNHLAALSALVGGLQMGGEDVEKLKKEVEMWKAEWGKGERVRRRLEGLLEEATTAAAKGDNKGDGHSFTAALIDGDHLVFRDSLLQAGFQGGQSAAKILADGLQDADGVKLPEQGQVVVQVFINKSAIGNSLVKTGAVPSWGVYDSFWQGFQGYNPLFIVIDVGTLKQAAENKIREHLKLYSYNGQCASIILGCASDNSDNLRESLSTDHQTKVIMLRAVADDSSEHGISIPDLFRSSPVPSAPQSFSAILQSASPSAVLAPPKVPVTGSHLAASNDDKTRSPASTHDTLSEAGTEVIQWEEVNRPAKDRKDRKDGKDRKEKKERKDKKGKRGPGMSERSPPKEDEWVEAGGRKVGRRYKDKGKGGIAVASVRNLKPRPCHTYYLSPWGCRASEDCDYSHEYGLSDTQMDELARLAKEIICPFVRNHKCNFSEEECVYGHRCPRGSKCNFGDTCRFNVIDNAHGEDD